MNKTKLDYVVQKAEPQHLERILEIVQQAQQYFKESGIDQWQDGYPDRETLYKDIKNGELYVVLQQGHPKGCAALCFGADPTYAAIYEGSWQSEKEYASLHRIALDNSVKGTGMAGFLFSNLENIAREKQVYSVRGDTHKDNLPMRKFLLKCGFSMRGVIYLADGQHRIAFEKIL